MRLLEIYDYMYYKIARWSIKYDDNRRISYTASAVVTLSQIVVVMDIVGLILLEFINQDERSLLLKKFYPYFVILVLFFAIANDWKYRNKFNLFHDKWKSDNRKTRVRKGVLISILIIIPLLFIPILLNIIDYQD